MELIPYPNPNGPDKSKVALVFVYGSEGMNAAWGDLPALLASEKRLRKWRILQLDLQLPTLPNSSGCWARDPRFGHVTAELRALWTSSELSSCSAIAIAAGSIGGLLLQRVLLDVEALRSACTHLFLFGTPSLGVENARGWMKWRQQPDEIVAGSQWVSDLRGDWEQIVGKQPRFHLRVAAAPGDSLFPLASAVDPFPVECQRLLEGP
jgi:hypothetical protein